VETSTTEAHAESAEEIARRLKTDLKDGLSEREAQSRRERFGPNELQEQEGRGLVKMLLQQFASFLIIILLAAAAVSFAVGETVDAAAIVVIVILNAALGLAQEFRAERALAALKKMSAPFAAVIRQGDHRSVPSRELVPGDVVVLEAGNYVPADLRLVETVDLRIDESSLTGESAPVDKRADAVLEEGASLGDRTNCAFMNTTIAFGRGRGLVVRTGMQTEMGEIAGMIQASETEATPLQRKLNQLGKWLGILSLCICAVIFVYGVVRDTELGLLFRQGISRYLAAHRGSLVELFMTAVSLAIAAVPEGLPAVVTICLALGMKRMAERHALIRRLPAVETLGSATVICTDKTGTLTQNQMTVVEGWTPGMLFEVSGEGCNPEGDFYTNGGRFVPDPEGAIGLLLQGGLLCNDSLLGRRVSAEPADAGGEVAGWRITGDPTEGALVVAAAKAGMWKTEREEAMPRLDEFAFDSDRKRMTTIHALPAGEQKPPGAGGSPYIAYVKGAPDIVLELCTRQLVGETLEPLSASARERISHANTDMARRALRVLAVAYRPVPRLPDDEAPPGDVERELIFVGLMGMIDPARPEAAQAVAVARDAGIRTIMVTGDYMETATAIAAKIGILRPGGRVLSGAELDELGDADFEGIVDHVDVYARVSPKHKVRIVEMLRSRGHIAAMTGDGVNDAPALKRADIGVAMGITGTDVSKETAEMVLTDDNFASIVSAVEQGRIIYSNIRKFVFYLISCNIGEILIIFLSMLAGLPIPLTPIQILWLNLATDGAPALALGVERGEPDIMGNPPRPPGEPIINREMLAGLLVQAVVMSASVIGAFLVGLGRGVGGLEGPRTYAFATLVCSELFRVFAARSETHSVFAIGPFTNRWMLAAVAASLALLLCVTYIGPLAVVFGTVPLTAGDWLLILPFTLAAAVAAELTKMVSRWRKRSAR